MNIFVFLGLLPFVLTENRHTYYWRDYRGFIPHDAFGFGNLYVAQVPYQGSLPATLYPKRKEAVTEYSGNKVVITHGIKLLCDTSPENFYWEFVNLDALTEEYLADCVTGGYESGSTLYVGRLFLEGEWKIGKIFPPGSNWRGMRIWNKEGKQHAANDFEILKTKFSPFSST